MPLDDLTEAILGNLGFQYVPANGRAGRIYVRGNLMLTIRDRDGGKIAILDGMKKLGPAADDWVSIWGIEITAGTPAPIVMALIRRASEYQDVVDDRW